MEFDKFGGLKVYRKPRKDTRCNIDGEKDLKMQTK